MVTNITAKRSKIKLPELFKLLRDIGCFFIGGFSFVHETLANGEGRVYILLGSVGLMGLPVTLLGDKISKKQPTDEDE